MAKTKFSSNNYVVRLIIAVILVFSTFNPLQPYSYFYWAVSPLLSDVYGFSIIKALLGVVLLIGWTIYLRATSRSLGIFGILLAVGFFGLLLWLIVDQGWVGIENRDAITWLILIGLSCVLSVGVSWSHIRRRITGQLDVDETDA